MMASVRIAPKIIDNVKGKTRCRWPESCYLQFQFSHLPRFSFCSQERYASFVSYENGFQCTSGLVDSERRDNKRRGNSGHQRRRLRFKVRQKIQPIYRLTRNWSLHLMPGFWGNEVQQSPDNHTMLNHTTLLFAPNLPGIKWNVTNFALIMAQKALIITQFLSSFLHLILLFISFCQPESM